jgi:enoyl-CoA hydratase
VNDVIQESDSIQYFMNYTGIKVSIADGIAVVTISRPQVLNALNSNFFTEFNDFLDGLETRLDVNVLVITGEGKAFVAGADIAEMSQMNKIEAHAFSKKGQDTFDRLEMLKMPVIAAVNGFALGGGCELSMACDFRIASRSAKFGQPELNLGLIPGYGGTQRFSRIAGLGNALYAIMTTEMIPAEDALRMGLVQKVVDDEILMEETMKIARKLAFNKSLAATTVKEIIRKGAGMDLHEAISLESEAFAGLFEHPTTKEGMNAFLEKRKPVW